MGGGAGRALGRVGTSLELPGPQEAQHSEAEKWLPTQLHPLPGLLPHDADGAALLQVGPRLQRGPRDRPALLQASTGTMKGLGFAGTHSSG